MSWDQFCKSVKRATGKAADAINHTADVASMQIKLAGAERKLEDAYTALGKVAYLHFFSKDSSVEEVAKSMKVVEAAKKEVDDWNEKIRAAKEARAKATKKAEEATDAPADNAPASDPDATQEEPQNNEAK
ncbi:MAG: hypothetical protein IJX28_08615 [Clostridia bacterium]|nr:hypothetical protein [Clostridia bacterium]